MKQFVHLVKPRDIEHGGIASAEIKRELREWGASAADARRAGIIAFEGEMNLIVYADHGGKIQVTLSREWIEILIEDDGPGIGDIDLAMTPGYSTAPAWATNLGFGAGMGLPNMQRSSDEFEMHSHVGQGTLIRCRIERREHDVARTGQAP